MQFQKACAAGNIAACASAAALLGEKCPKALTLSWPDAMDMLQRSCDGGDDAQCTELASLLVNYVKGPDGEPPKEVEERHRALKLRVARHGEARCNKGDGAGCFVFAGALETGLLGAIDYKRLYDVSCRGCELGSEASCTEVAYDYLLRDDDYSHKLPEAEPRAVFTRMASYVLRLCRTGQHDDFCTQLNPSWFSSSEPDEVEAVARKFCQRFDFPGMSCRRDTIYDDEFCRYYCQDDVLHLPE